MTQREVDALRNALARQGFQGLSAPSGTMAFDEDYLMGIQLTDLLETLVARREKIFGSVAVVGNEAAKKSYDDVIAAIVATKDVIGTLVPP